jgi:hypothetical protein
MSITGRTTRRWGRDKSARWDPGPTNRSRSYPAIPQPETPAPAEPHRVELRGRRGAAERTMIVTSTPAGASPMTVEVALVGWYADRVTLDERQARRLLEVLHDQFRLHDEALTDMTEAV